jgi:hypothetical protein
MNIFYLDSSPLFAAEYHCDKHVVKMILESAQLLSTAHRVLDGEIGQDISPAGRKLKVWKLPDWRDELMYKATHVNHPCAIWVRQSNTHYRWLFLLFSSLCKEYTKRYNKVHLCETKLHDAFDYAPDRIDTLPYQEPPQCMPDECKVPGRTVDAYRKYYMQEKRDIAEWRYSLKPGWYE